MNFCVSWLSVIKCVSERLAKKSDHNVKFTFCISSCLTTSLQNSYSSLPALTKPSLLTDRDILPNAQCYWTISTNLGLVDVSQAPQFSKYTSLGRLSSIFKIFQWSIILCVNEAVIVYRVAVLPILDVVMHCCLNLSDSVYCGTSI